MNLLLGLRPALLAALLSLLSVSSAIAAPADFTLSAATGPETFSLAAARGRFVALHFLLKTECPFCLRHTHDYFARAASLPGVVQVFIKPDSAEEIARWATKLPADEVPRLPVYRDPDAALAEAFGVPDGYSFHQHIIHYPATILLGPDGREVFRYVGKNNRDRLTFDQLAAKVAELSRH